MHFHNDTKHLHVGTGLRRIFGHEKGLTAGKPSLGSLEAQRRARGTGKCKRRTPAEMEADRSADAALASAATLATVRDEEFQALWSQHTKRVLSGERVASGYAACEGNEEGGEEEGGEEGDKEGNEEGGEPRFGLDPDSTRLVDLVPGHVVDTVRRWPNRLVEQMVPAVLVNLGTLMVEYTLPENEPPAPELFWRCAVDGMDNAQHTNHGVSCLTCKKCVANSIWRRYWYSSKMIHEDARRQSRVKALELWERHVLATEGRGEGTIYTDEEGTIHILE